ncbi:hypothetical protein [Emticicia sp. BO119]|uniref:hypothetical protein n=1 Tax=Emticicia sp. BO119 TaxID=2757768 RepID=UPI0015F07A82|nr:hypothetical protein [Emticicia sp. BO119]MBA4852023.1 hypothetical protein [Emticicia sp. BO119]
MNSHEAVVKRFFEILDELVRDKKLSYVNDFYKKHKINIGNITQLKKNHSRNMLKMAWLIDLVETYRASAHYLLTGEGPHFEYKKGREKSPKHIGMEKRIDELEAENQQLKEVINEFKLILSNFDRAASKKRKHALIQSPLQTD